MMDVGSSGREQEMHPNSNMCSGNEHGDFDSGHQCDSPLHLWELL